MDKNNRRIKESKENINETDIIKIFNDSKKYIP